MRSPEAVTIVPGGRWTGGAGAAAAAMAAKRVQIIRGSFACRPADKSANVSAPVLPVPLGRLRGRLRGFGQPVGRPPVEIGTDRRRLAFIRRVNGGNVPSHRLEQLVPDMILFLLDLQLAAVRRQPPNHGAA